MFKTVIFECFLKIYGIILRIGCKIRRFKALKGIDRYCI